MTTTFEDDELWVQPCSHPEHRPPSHIVIPAGKKMVHTCPACGATQVIRNKPICFAVPMGGILDE